MDSYVVKVQHKGTMRRLTLGGAEKTLSFGQLQSRIRGIFELPASAEFGLTYVDTDGDSVTMVDDEDLKDALVLQKLNPLRVTIENLQGGSNDVKITSSDKVVEAPKSEPVAPAANPEPVEVPTVTEEKDWTIVDEASGSSSSGASSPARETSYDAVKVDSAEAVEPVISSDENPTVTEEKSSIIVDEAQDSSIADSSPATSTPVDSTEAKIAEAATAAATATEKEATLEAAIPAEKEAPAEAPAPAEKEGREAEEAKKDDWEIEIHFGVRCDGCNMVPIAGPRFKSCKKPSYDLCLGCYDASGSEKNEYARIGRSFYRIGCPAYSARMMGRPQQRMCRKPCQYSNQARDPEVKGSASDNPAESKAAGAEKSTPVLHHGVQCDECGMVPIEGPRYRSCTRFNYDLCRNCFEKSGSNASDYACIAEPFQRRGPHPLKLRHVMRRAAFQHMPQTLDPRWTWVLDQLLPVVAELVAGEKETTDAPQAESAAATENADATSSAFKQEKEASEQQAEGAKVENKSVQIPVIWADKTGAESSSSTPETPSVKTGVEESPAGAPVAAAQDNLSTQEGLLDKLAAMGFEDSELNVELLKKNSFDLRKTVDDLCAAEDWESMLGELQEMGFSDASLNRRLMFKHNGSVKRVVRELVQLAKGEQ